MRRLSVALFLLLLVVPLAWSDPTSGAQQSRVVHRVVASPTPAAGLAVFSDLGVFRVDVPSWAVVVVDASSSSSAFYLRASHWGAPAVGSPVPLSPQEMTLDGGEASSWRVEVDPAAGANVTILVEFGGHVGAPDGPTPASFTLTDVSLDKGCGPGACLP